MSALKVTVEGLPKEIEARAVLTVEPKTATEFEAVIEAAGGAENFKPGYRSEYVWAEVDGILHLHVAPPADYVAVRQPVGHPFIREFAEQIDAAKAGEES